MQLNEEVEYILPAYEDLEENPIAFSISTNTPFLTFNERDKKFNIKPTSPVSCLGIFIVKVILSDSRLITEYQLSITVKNNAPFFDAKL